MPRFAREHEPGGRSRLPGPGQANDLAVEIPDIRPETSTAVEPLRPFDVESDTQLGILVFGEDALLLGSAPKEPRERSPVRASLMEVRGEGPAVQEEDESKER